MKIGSRIGIVVPVVLSEREQGRSSAARGALVRSPMSVSPIGPQDPKRVLRLEASNSHGTYFASDITTLRAESRFALGLFRPSAFVAVTGMS
jgi:hypothetical protein